MPAAGAPGTHPKFMLHTTGPSRFWVGVRLALPVREQRAMEPAMPPPEGPRGERPGRDERRFEPVVLLAVSASLSGGGLFFDAQPWLVFAFSAVLFSMLLWIPLVRGLTRSIAQMTRAAEQIAEGHFDIQVADRRPDELGRLGQAINRMAGRLAGFVTGQKRFLGDVAHELCSPIARTQMALGILEQRAAAAEQPYLDDLREEVQQMSTLVNELLSFSKAGLRRGQIPLRPVNLAELARRVVARENRDGRPIEISIAPDLEALAEPELLARALGNVVRNALYHAGNAGPIAVEATADASGVTLTVVDSGPGVPEAALEKLFDPFYRVEASRSRETGGVGLGLAIVRTCLEACEGTVRAVNRQPNGLRVELRLGGVERPADPPAKG
jgi:two-component system sensor histidine kinase CpxA